VAPFADRVEAAISGLFDYAGDLVASRRKDLKDDLLSALIQAEEDGERLSSEELRWQIVNMTFAGHDTTKNSSTYLMRLFCEHPDQWRRLREDPSLAPNAIDEGLRMEPVIPTTMRTTVDEFVYDGVVFPAGTPVMLRADTSNRDPSMFFDPDRFDITRHNAGQHMTFGGGVHYCLGANLAKAEMQEALPILAEAMPEVHFDGPGDWRPRSSMLLGADSMPVAFATA
jgi:cytochrome P450